MFILGLTGSIGMGKSTVAAYLIAKGHPVCDADAIVHRLYRGAALPAIEAAFPGTTTTAGVDRQALSAALARNPAAFARLEAIIHPLVRAEEQAFLGAARDAGAKVAVLEIPLLFEIGADRLVDAVAVVSAPAAIQRQRVLERPGMTPEKLDLILSRQTPDPEKRRLADFVIDTSGPVEATYEQVDRMLEALAGRPGHAYQNYWT